ncbi:MAG: hypothetical protein EAY69_03470 [Cytophagales bacterium]|nr:MAG: hypothetical protein EAY69_03470 [Cytophagales bacterium]
MNRLFLFYLIIAFSFSSFTIYAQTENAAEGKSIPEQTAENSKIVNLIDKKINQKNYKHKNNQTKKNNPIVIHQNKKNKKENITQKNKQIKSKKYTKQHYGSTKKSKKLSWWRPWLDLDWLMIAIRTSLTLLQAILLAISFGVALLFLIHSLSEERADGSGWYEYFIRFGFIAFPGWLMLLAGFVALFGGTPNLLIFLIIGGILGGVSFLLSILVWKDSIFNVPWR